LLRKVVITKKVHDDLINIALKYSPKIICGLLSGRVKSGVVTVEEVYPIPTQSGPRIHFKPVWSAYRQVKEFIYNSKKDVVGEFHTHPDGSEELNINDRKILKKLRSGLWIIVTPEKVVPWCVESINESEPNFRRLVVEII
jgi:proteasome lid subunit RPN8/RPN11